MSNKIKSGNKIVQIIWLSQLLIFFTFFLTTNNQSDQLSNLIIKLLIIISLSLQSLFIGNSKQIKLGVIFTNNRSTITQTFEKLIWLLFIIGYFCILYMFYYK